MKKVLYLHGLNSTLHNDRQTVLEKNNLEIFAPQLDYEKEPNTMNFLLENFKADIIIGSSAGGLIGYYISGIKQVPALLFNPALPFRFYIKNIPPLESRQKLLQIVLGAKDDVVPAKETFNYLDENRINNTEIHWVQELKHSIPIEIFKTELEFFLNKIDY